MNNGLTLSPFTQFITEHNVRTLATVLTLVSISLVPLTAQAQAAATPSRFAIEITGDGAFPTSKLGDAELSTGFGFGANLQVRLQMHLQAYAGWEYHHFQSEQLIASQDTDIDQTGYTFGLRFAHPFTAEATTDRRGRALPGYWVRAGALVKHIELENDAGDIISDTKHGLGWEAGAGVILPLSDRLSLTPGARFQSLTRDLTIASTTRSVTLSFATATVGLTFRF
mgnify:CR=1 FL=1